MLIRLPYLLLNINVRVAVNVNTQISISHARIKAHNMAMTTNCEPQRRRQCKTMQKQKQPQEQKEDQQEQEHYQQTAPRQQQQQQLQRLQQRKQCEKKQQQLQPQQRKQCEEQEEHSRGTSGISQILIINLLTLLLLSLCCDVVCKSNEHHALSKIAKSGAVGVVGEKIAAVVGEPEIAADNVNNTIAPTIALVTQECQQNCKLETDMFQDDFGITCAASDTSEKCYKTRCFNGCAQWWRALQEFEPCQEACSSTPFYPFDLPCIAACEMAQRHYWHLQRLTMEPLISASPPPVLLLHDPTDHPPDEQPTAEASPEDSVMVNSLRLQWAVTFPDNYLATRPFNIQYQYVVSQGETNETQKQNPQQPLRQPQQQTQEWFNLADYDCNENFDCEILDGLMAYTSYRFRFELPFGDDLLDVLYSPMTAVYQTPPTGAPISKPNIEQALALDHSHVAVFWRAGQFTNGPLSGFKLILHNAEQNFTVEQLLPAHVNQHTFAELTPTTNYTVQVAMLNTEGEGPYAESSVLTKQLASSTYAEDEILLALLVTDYKIDAVSLVPFAKIRPIYQSEQLISGYAKNFWTSQIYVVDIAGDICSFRSQSEPHVTKITLGLDKTNFKAAKLSVDWLNQRLYIAGVSPAQTWSIISTNLSGGAVESLIGELTEAPQQLEVDAINGWLFWTTATTGALMRLNLATKQLRVLRQATQIGHFVNMYEKYLLLAYNRSDDEYYELSYDGLYAGRLQLNSSRWLQGAVESFGLYGSNLLATNGTHLLLQDYGSLERRALFHVDDVDWCARMLPLPYAQWHAMQPLPRPAAGGAVPAQLQALVTANLAEISWQAPAPIHGLQTARAWQQWEYELEIMDVASNSAYNIRNIKSAYFKVEKLQASSLYKLRVRATAAALPSGIADGDGMAVVNTAAALGAGAWSAELLTRTWPLGEHKLLWAGAQGGMYESNELGVQARKLAPTPALLRDFEQLNGSIYYVQQDGRLRCVHTLNPELNCTLRASHARSVAYDWRGGRVYWADEARNCVLRAKPDGSARELLPIHEALQLQIDALQGQLYYSTGKRLLRRPLSGGAQADEQEYFHVNGGGGGGYGGMIRGFALDALQQQLYWVVRQQQGHVRLFRSSVERMGAATATKWRDTLLPGDIALGTLRYVPHIESLLWVAAGDSGALQLLRAAELQQQTVMQAPALVGAVSGVRVRVDYTPYADESVLPDAVDAATVRIDDGYWDDFNIRWAASSAADNYTVYYKVLLQARDAKQTRLWALEVAEPYLRITEFHQPQLLLDVSITPHTYWSTGPTVHVQLHTPAAAPTQPKRLRVYVQRSNLPLQAPNISALVRWEQPENVSLSAELVYKIYCWLDEELFAERVHNASSGSGEERQPLQATVTNLRAGATYTFQVQAFIAGRTRGGQKTAYHALHIDPEVQSVPRLLYATSEHVAALDLDLETQRVLVHTSSEVEYLVLLHAEQRLLWVNENVELMMHVPGAAPPVKLARMRAEVLALSVDWIARVVYWAELSAEQQQPAQQSVCVYKLDLCQFEGRVMLGTRVCCTAPGRLLRDLTVLPYSQSLLWLEHAPEAAAATLVGRNLSDGSVLAFNGSAATSVWRLLAANYAPDMEAVTLIDPKGQMCTYDVARHMCAALKAHFNVVADELTQLERDAGYLYTLKNDTVRAYSRRKQTLEYQLPLPHARKIRAYQQQQYPPRDCLLPGEQQRLSLLQPQLLVVAERFVTLQLPPLNTLAHCWLPLPGVKYQLTLSDADKNTTRHFSSYVPTYNLTQLEPFANYTLSVRATTYYQQQLGLEPLAYRDFVLRTAVGTPTQPQNFSGLALNPTEIQLSWAPPQQLYSDAIIYELHWQLENATLDAHQTLEDVNSFVLSNLAPAQTYRIWLQVYAAQSPHKFNSTESIVVATYERPGPLQMLDRSAYNITLGWQPTANLSGAILECRAYNGEDEFSIDISENLTVIVITDLEPKTKYEFYLKLLYADVDRAYSWPEPFNEHFVFETLGDTPGSPGKPLIEHITGEIFKVFWEAARENGAPVVEYQLEALQARSSNKRVRRDVGAGEQHNKTISLWSQLPWAEEPQPLEDRWILFCNTTALSCIVREMHTLRFIMFRVRARNVPYGWGPYSEDSERVFEPFVLPEKRNSLVFAIIAPAAIVSSCVIVLVIVRMIQARRAKAKKLLEKSRPSIWSNLSTLQQQQLMSGRGRGFSITSHSTVYNGGPLSDADIALLPQINWSQITILNFLGSGAFGEVYEGLVKHEDEDEVEKVAIKTLRKGASEFAELLQEAQLMSNFKHENIVRLIGICSDAESISIIMEHMGGGDLLSYLRESRPNINRPVASLQLLELLTMCIDVVTGCCYLEDMHFVHRDLACRNCLVSSREPSKRVVKIGDFGLARDIYKNDYYRKEGEGLLPVRWMSPESLVDGVFTTQSDVWAFAVLCWEILTLGQQPYAARNNFEVLNFVSEGGRLKQPDNCPDKLFELMLECWNLDPDSRPSFRRCRNTLIEVKTDVRRVSFGPSMDDDDAAHIYANHNGVVLSSFLANPLASVAEESDRDDGGLSAAYNGERADLKVHFKVDIREVEDDTASDNSQVILTKKLRAGGGDDQGDKPEYYINEGISRL